MRKVGQLTSGKDAQRLHRYLIHKGIANRVDQFNDQWDIWAIEENQIEAAREIFGRFQQLPNASEFDAPIPPPVAVEPEVAQKAPVVRRSVGPNATFMTMFVMGMCVWLTFVTEFGEDKARIQQLSLASSPAVGLTEIESGQIYRLITPMFMHGSALHLMMNMMAFWVLASSIERVRGSWTLLAVIIFTNLVANFTQYFYSGPNFMGASGVVFGLFGYIWLRSILLPADGLYMPKQVVTQMIFWMVLCIVMESQLRIANGAHIGGLIGGMILGAAPRLWRKY